MLDGALLDGVIEGAGRFRRVLRRAHHREDQDSEKEYRRRTGGEYRLRPVGPVLGVVVVSGHRGMLAAARYLQRSSSSLERSASANCQNGPKLIRATPSGPYDEGSDLSGNAIALTGSGSSEVKRRNVSGS